MDTRHHAMLVMIRGRWETHRCLVQLSTWQPCDDCIRICVLSRLPVWTLSGH